jgi:hypothetical protein
MTFGRSQEAYRYRVLCGSREKRSKEPPATLVVGVYSFTEWVIHDRASQRRVRCEDLKTSAYVRFGSKAAIRAGIESSDIRVIMA